MFAMYLAIISRIIFISLLWCHIIILCNLWNWCTHDIFCCAWALQVILIGGLGGHCKFYDISTHLAVILCLRPLLYSCSICNAVINDFEICIVSTFSYILVIFTTLFTYIRGKDARVGQTLRESLESFGRRERMAWAWELGSGSENCG